MIHNVYILKTNGTALISRRYGSLEVDENLISGFITAINTFAEQIVQRHVDEIVMGDLKFIYSRSRKLDVIYAVCADSEMPTEELKNVFDKVDEKFVEKYDNMFNDTLLKDNTIFQEFIPSLDELMVHAKLIGGKEGRAPDEGVIGMFKKLIRLTSSVEKAPEETPVGDAAQETTIEITQPEEHAELSQVYAINDDVIANTREIPIEDILERMALQYINGKNTVEDIILSLQLLGYKVPSVEKLLDFFEECERSGYLKRLN